MKRILSIIIIFIFSGLSIQAQSISAGIYGPDDYYYDFEPDICLEPVYPDPWPQSEIFPLDINNDGTIDISFQTEYSEANFYHHRTWVDLGYHCEIAVSTDTCKVDTTSWPDLCQGATDIVNQVAKVFQIGENIAESDNWIYKDEYTWISYHFNGVCNPHCSHIITPAIIGVRIFVDTDTLYGWVKLKDVESWRFTIDKYACNTTTMGIQEMESTVHIYPNPAGEILNISTPWFSKEATISIYDLSGQEVFNKIISGMDNQIDISNFHTGMYILKYSYQDKLLMQKVLKQ